MPAYLVEHRDRAVGKDELVASIWERVDVSDTKLSQTVLRACRAVDDDGQTQNVIRTVSRFGYRWVADVVEAEGQRPAPAPKTKADTAPGGRASLFARPVAAVRGRNPDFRSLSGDTA